MVKGSDPGKSGPVPGKSGHGKSGFDCRGGVLYVHCLRSRAALLFFSIHPGETLPTSSLCFCADW